MSAEQAFWLPISKPVSEKPPVQLEPVQKEIPRKLSLISLVKDSFNKMRSHLNDFDKVITVKTKVTGQNEGTWGFEHIRGAFNKEVIPFVKTLKEYFQMFDQGLTKEITHMKEVFNQMETEVEQCSVDRKCFEIQKKELFIENDRLLEKIIFQDYMCTAMHVSFEHKCVLPANENNLAYVELENSYIAEYSKVLELKAELVKKKDMIEQDVFIELLKSYSKLEKHFISLEITMQQSKERFQNDQLCENQDSPEFHEFFKINELKAQLQAKNTTIGNLKNHIQELKGKVWLIVPNL
ncbi:hypothetical protein Tco_1232102 [Tanacetum coccineum]